MNKLVRILMSKSIKRILEPKGVIKLIIKGCILNPGHGKDSSPGFQFLYTKRQISNIIKV